jgi:CheY-like chemotaxis protein
VKLCTLVPCGANGDVQIAVREEQSARRKTAYRSTVSRLLEKSPDVAGFAIPAKVKGQDFNPLYLVEHIRLHADSQLARKPIVIYSADEAPQHRPATDKEELLYLCDWGVSWTESGLEEVSASVLPEAVGEIELEGYVKKHALEPRFASGPHDMANLWGPYAVVLALSKVNDSFSPIKDQIANELSEDTFYIKKLLSHRKQIVPEGDITRLEGAISQLKILLTRRGRKTRVLVVEDQLADGWRDAYDCLAKIIGLENGFKYAETVIEAKTQVPADLDAVLLDVRLQPDRDAPAHQDFPDLSSGLSGVTLAKDIRERSPSVPILAATASNKVWTLESLAQHGVNAYWVKESPVTSASERHCVISTIDLLEKLYAVLSWSESVRPRVDRAFEISKVAGRHNQRVEAALTSKAKLLAVHEFRGLDSVRRGVDEELHLDISFMILYSMINEFFSWLVHESDKSGRKGEIRAPGGGSLSLYEPLGEKKIGLTKKAIEIAKNYDRESWKELRLPESVFFDVALMWRGLRGEATRFDHMKIVRNNLPLIHGHMLDSGERSVKNATAQEVDELADMLLTFVTQLDKPQPHLPVST